MGDRQEKKNSRNGKDSPGMNAGQKRLLQWHPAFFAGLQIELSEEAEYLSFESEHMLSSRPMQLDILVIKKDRERQIRKNIGQIFRTYNIVEYKSPDDSLTIDDFYKVYGYTCFYKADTGKTNEIRAEEKLFELIRKKIRKGKSMAQIADELEEKEESILPLYNRLKEEEGL